MYQFTFIKKIEYKKKLYFNYTFVKSYVNFKISLLTINLSNLLLCFLEFFL